jgi:two-component system sensor histidine kinase GlrK
MNIRTEPSEMREGLGNAILKGLRHHPKSFLKLILVGFLLVALPLISALIYSAISIDRLAGQSKKAVYQAEQIAHGSRVLVEAVAAMERSIRLSLIIGDASLLEGYFQAHKNFENTAASLSALPLGADQKRLLDGLRLSETKTFQRLENARPSPEVLSHSVDDFAPLLDSHRLNVR